MTESYLMFFSHIRFQIILIVFQTGIGCHFSFGQSGFSEAVEVLLKQEAPVDFNLVPAIIVMAWDQENVLIDTFGDQSTIITNSNLLIELGSVSKPVTAHLIDSILASENISLSSSICQLVPDSLCNAYWKVISIQDILDHQAGLPLRTTLHEDMSIDDDPLASMTAQQFSDWIKIARPTKQIYQYSHSGYAFFYWLMMDKLIANDDSFHGLSGFYKNAKSEELFQGHSFTGREVAHWNSDIFFPSVGIKSTLPALFNLVRHISSETSHDPLFIMNDELKEQLKFHRKRKSYPLYKGWFLISSGKDILCYHNGHTNGHSVSVVFNTVRDQGVIIFSNGASGSRDLNMSILNMFKRSSDGNQESKE